MPCVFINENLWNFSSFLRCKIKAEMYPCVTSEKQEEEKREISFVISAKTVLLNKTHVFE